jgi:hypothetical protein
MGQNKKFLIAQKLCFNRWSGKRDSNSRPSPWQGDALPLSYFRLFKIQEQRLTPVRPNTMRCANHLLNKYFIASTFTILPQLPPLFQAFFKKFPDQFFKPRDYPDGVATILALSTGYQE